MCTHWKGLADGAACLSCVCVYEAVFDERRASSSEPNLTAQIEAATAVRLSVLTSSID